MTAAAATSERLTSAVADQREWMADLLLRLLAAPTVLGAEESGQRIVAQELEALGMTVTSVPLDAERLRAHPLAAPFDWDVAGKRNVVGEWANPDGDGRSLTLSGHIDVPEPQAAELWTRSPWEPHRDGDEIVGWGILKSGLVAQLGALRALRAAGLTPRGTVRLQSVVEEETSGNGTLAAALAFPPADGALVAGCLGDVVPYAQVGVLWFTLRVVVVPAHAGDGVAVSAIDKALGLVAPLQRMVDGMNADPHPAYRDVPGAIGLNVGTIRGGTLPSIGPGECEISCRIALFPDQTIADQQARIEAVVAEAAAADPDLAMHPPEVRFVGFSGPGYVCEPDAPIVRILADAHEQRRGRRPRPVALTTALDARTFHHLGTPATSAGPRVSRLHAVNEAVHVDEMVEAAEITARFVGNWCGTEQDDV